MKHYSILIKGTGPCGEGDENSADIRLLDLMKSLQNSGHNLTCVSLQADGIMLPILGVAEEHPAGNVPSTDTITLATLSEQISRLEKKLSRNEATEKKSDRAKDGEVEGGKKRGKKNEGGGAPSVEPKPGDEPNATVDPVIVTAPAAPEAGNDAADEQAKQEADADKEAPDQEQEQTQPHDGSDGNPEA